jgi:prephenate dehydrogenase
MPASVRRLGIVGLGQIGGSIAAALKNDDRYAIFGFDSNRTLLDIAKKRRVISQSFESDVDLIRNVDIIVIALPMFAIHDSLEKNRDLLRDKTLVLDTGSTKRDVIRTAERLGMTNFIGGHPYAGTEKSAPDGWDGGLFVNQRYFVIETRGCRALSMRLAEDFAEAIGSIPEQIDASDHDRMFAFASGLPHMIAYALVDSMSDSRRRARIDRDFLAHSFRSSTRVAGSQPDTVAQFLWQNRRALKREIDIFIDKLGTLSERLADDSIDRFLGRITRLRNKKVNLERIDG